MPQFQLSIFSSGMTLININLGYQREDNALTYFYGNLPVFTHDVDDRFFRMITSQLYVNGSAKQADICRAFGIRPINVKRRVKLYREKGIAGFFEEPRRRGVAVLTPEVLAQVQGLLDEGMEIPLIASKLDLLADTLRKALCGPGKLHKPQIKEDGPGEEVTSASSKSERSGVDAAAPIGMGATGILGRLAASIFRCEASEPVFSCCHDVPNGGVLLALSALIAVGLLAHTERYFQLPRGFYRLDTIFLFLAFMALVWIKIVEKLGFCAPGE